MSRRANGEGSIHQRQDGRWAASLSLGRLKRKHFLGHSRAEVAGKLAAAVHEQQQGVPIVSNKQNLAQYLNYWLDSVSRSVRPKTYESYDLNVRRLVPLIGKSRLSSLTPASIERAYGELRQPKQAPGEKESLTTELTSSRRGVSDVLAAGRSGETTQQGAKSK